MSEPLAFLRQTHAAFIKTLCFAALFIVALCCASYPVFARDMTPHPRVRLQSLDKITARTMTFEADVGSTLRFGPLFIRVQECKKASPLEKPESAAFMQIWEVDPGEEPKWVFSGWMFSSSPALSAMDHPIYDVWVLDCLTDKDNMRAKENSNDAQDSEDLEQTEAEVDEASNNTEDASTQNPAQDKPASE